MVKRRRQPTGRRPCGRLWPRLKLTGRRSDPPDPARGRRRATAGFSSRAAPGDDPRRSRPGGARPGAVFRHRGCAPRGLLLLTVDCLGRDAARAAASHASSAAGLRPPPECPVSGTAGWYRAGPSRRAAVGRHAALRETAGTEVNVRQQPGGRRVLHPSRGDSLFRSLQSRCRRQSSPPPVRVRVRSVRGGSATLRERPKAGAVGLSVKTEGQPGPSRCPALSPTLRNGLAGDGAIACGIGRADPAINL